MNRLSTSGIRRSLVRSAVFLLGAALVSTAQLSSAESADRARETALALSDVTFVIFDTETTGLSAKKDRIVELGAVKVRNGKVLEEKSWLINPQRPIPYYAERVHGISDEMVADSPAFKEIYPDFLSFIGDAVLVAHNAPFDIRFVEAEVSRAGFDQPANDVIDSLRLFRNWFPDSDSHSLSSMADYVELPKDPNHRAVMDALVVAMIMEKGISRIGPHPNLDALYQDAGGPLRFN